MLRPEQPYVCIFCHRVKEACCLERALFRLRTNLHISLLGFTVSGPVASAQPLREMVVCVDTAFSESRVHAH